MELWNRYVPSVTATRPRAYAIEPGASSLVEHLALHGVRTRPVETSVTIAAEELVLASFERAERAFQGHRRVERVELETREAELEVGPGWTLVPLDQPLGTLAVILLEPASEDGLFAWNFLDSWCKEGERLPIHRVAAELPDALTKP